MGTGHRTVLVAVLAILAGAFCASLTGARATAQCVGDCDGNNAVETNDLILGVSIALGTQPLTACPAVECQGDGTAPINCLLQGVHNALSGCDRTPTATETVAAPTATNTVLLPTPTSTVAQPTATGTTAPSATPTMTSTAAPATATATVAPTTTSTPLGPSCSFAAAGCTTSACSCGDASGTDYHIGASGSVTGPLGSELRVNINALGGGMVDCGGWTRIFGSIVTGCDILGCCRREDGEPETVQWSVFEVIDLPCMCPAAEDPGSLQHNFLIQCQLRPGPVMEVERTSTGCP